MAYISAADSMGLSSFNFCGGLRKKHLFWNRMRIGRSRSSKVVDFGSNQKGVCDFLLVINSNFGPILHRFWDTRVIGWKLRIFPTPPLFDAPLRGNSSEFLDETYQSKTRRMALLYGENRMILTSTVFAWITRVTDGGTDRRTDGIAIAYARFSIYAVARKNDWWLASICLSSKGQSNFAIGGIATNWGRGFQSQNLPFPWKYQVPYLM